VIKIDKRVPRPEAIAHFIARHDLAGLLQKDDQNLKGLFREFKSQTVLAQFANF